MYRVKFYILKWLKQMESFQNPKHLKDVFSLVNIQYSSGYLGDLPDGDRHAQVTL